MPVRRECYEICINVIIQKAAETRVTSVWSNSDEG